MDLNLILESISLEKPKYNFSFWVIRNGVKPVNENKIKYDTTKYSDVGLYIYSIRQILPKYVGKNIR